ncbi:capsular exopolysaccharide family [Arachidicoccus rhizosphaerae]|uniref:non-specific protein-tyrosine kinase n=1 Tax=Arachidicoccus rhizosphaerae TaxID=551991 RepID=A0A1H4ADG3_9BACT|nr:tyrosine-protein kinase [Arachidicoccus rhizosphaerae]SEA33977.1 capsular exopolysaccharide family [Arachidicoccus rhizosphaerae]
MQTTTLDQLVPVKETKFDFTKIFHRIRANWYYCVICAIVMVGLAGIYLYVANPTYKAMATVLIKDNTGQNNSPQSNGISSLQSLGLFPGASNVDNERDILVSYPLIHQVVSDLQLYLNFSTYKDFRSKPLYKKSLPFTTSITGFSTDNLDPSQLSYEFTLNGKSGFTVSSDKHVWKGKWSVPVVLPIGQLTLEKNELTNDWDGSQNIKMDVSSINAVADGFKENINAEISDKQTSIINLSLNTTIPEQGIDIMNGLIHVYQLSNIEDNNRITDSTIEFLNNRLFTVGAELDSIEGNIQHFKQHNELADLPTQSQSLIANAGENAKELAAQQVQLSITNSLIEYMHSQNGNDRVVPASLTINDGSLSAIIDNYNKLLLQKERVLLSATPDHPVVKNLDNQIKGLRSDMLSGLNSIKYSLEAGIGSMQQNEGALNNKIRRVPAQERTFTEYSRQQAIKQELFLFLLQKREESLIAKSSTVSNARIIVPGRVATQPVAPNKKLVLSFAMVLGLIFPFIISFFRNLTNLKVETKEDIANNTQTPVLAEILHNGKPADGAIVVTHSSRDPVAEQFRILRTDLSYLLPSQHQKVILFTSSMPNEGKSYVALNLSAMLAFSGKKVVIIDFDLRKPKLAERLGLNYENGFSQYAIGKATLDDIIYCVDGIPNLSFIPSGAIPPNPAELLITDRTTHLFDQLKQRFDYILIDSAPCIVTDARLLSRYADLTLFLVRLGTTYKELLKQIQEFYQQEKFPNLNLVINDLNRKRGKYYNGYQNYGADYGYFEN